MKPLSFLCLSMEYKGASFLTTLKSLGHRVFLLTEEATRHEPWPRESIDEIFYTPKNRASPHDRQELINGTAWLMREHGIDRIVALDDFDVEDAALLREEFRLPGMGQTTARHFRDKLAMRMLAEEHGIAVPGFSNLFNLESLRRFCESSTGPWVIKPRSEASAAGITKVATAEEAVAHYRSLGEQAYTYLIEEFAPGKVYHVDALVDRGTVAFARSSAYADPPLEIVQGGGLFQTRMLPEGSEDADELTRLTGEVMRAFGMRYSASHTEWIRNAAGEFLLLETASRVGGAYISNMVMHATGVDLWAEWARLEVVQLDHSAYEAPESRPGIGAVTIRAVGEPNPVVKGFDEGCVAEQLHKPYHVGRVFAGGSVEEVQAAQERFARALA